MTVTPTELSWAKVALDLVQVEEQFLDARLAAAFLATAYR